MALPKEKKDALADKVAEDVYKDWKSRENDLTKHEVSKQDARDIVHEGLVKGANRWAKENPR